MTALPASDPRLPITLITGFLGAGKSTLLNALLGHHDFADAAVLVNEFGDVGIDAALVRAVDGAVITLSTGCVCCAMRGELITALKDLHFKRVRGQVPEFSRLVVETSGLADPAPILATFLNEPVLASVYRIDGIVTVVDGEHGAAHLDTRNEARVQVGVADRLLISKVDRTSESDLTALRERLEHLNPFAETVLMRHGDIAPKQIIGCFDPSRTTMLTHHHEHEHEHGHHHPPHLADHRDGMHTTVLDIVPGQSRAGLESRIRLFLTLNNGRILRLKGIARCADGGLWALHGVRHVVYPAQALDRCPADLENRIVIIAESPPDETAILTSAP
ncbi:MAG: GTP-binding protein [Rhodospirillaceae bacterium]|nr:GTP-binding protein [Rhodospirillaceae bacterium]